MVGVGKRGDGVMELLCVPFQNFFIIFVGY